MAEQTFEEKIARLEEIIKKLETNNELPLKEVSNSFIEGKKLLKELNEELDELKKNASNTIVEN